MRELKQYMKDWNGSGIHFDAPNAWPSTQQSPMWIVSYPTVPRAFPLPYLISQIAGGSIVRRVVDVEVS